MSSYGWRVFAIPVLVVVTVLAVWDVTGAASTAPSPAVAVAINGASGGGFRAHTTTGTGSPISGPVTDGSFDPATAAGTLPDGAPTPPRGPGPGTSSPALHPG